MMVGARTPRDGVEQTYFFPDSQRLAILRELAPNGLLAFGEDLDAFVAWFNTGPFQFIKTGGSEFRVSRPLSQSEDDRLRKQYYALNPIGQKAWEAVLQAILQQLRTS
jgi:hypothetical protein